MGVLLFFVSRASSHSILIDTDSVYLPFSVFLSFFLSLAPLRLLSSFLLIYQIIATSKEASLSSPPPPLLHP